ncbi:MAG: hypothetical protein K9H16_04930 [Bacteroidales bacterium]|nr:hypothetical protein [Bacteroidales bacterium]
MGKIWEIAMGKIAKSRWEKMENCDGKNMRNGMGILYRRDASRLRDSAWNICEMHCQFAQ